MERVRSGYGTGMERIPNGYRTGTRTRVERLQNAFCQAFPVRFLLIGTVADAFRRPSVLIESTEMRRQFTFISNTQDTV